MTLWIHRDYFFNYHEEICLCSADTVLEEKDFGQWINTN